MSRLIFSLLPRTRDGGEFLSPRQPELGQFRFMRMRPSRVRWSCYKRGSTEYRTKGRGAKSRALPASIIATAWYISTASGRLGGEVGLADGVCRGSDQR